MPEEISRVRKYTGLMAKIGTTVAILFSVYELLYVLGLFSTAWAFLYPGEFRALALAIALALVFLFIPAYKKEPRDKLPWYDILAIIASFVVSGYIFIIYEDLLDRAVIVSTHEVVLGIIALVVVLEAARRTVGIVIPILSVLFLMYALYCNYFPGFLEGRGYSLTRVVSSSYLFEGGMFGMVLHIIVVVVFMFVLFGAFLQVTGASKFFVGLALAVFGHVRGGPAKVAVLASTLMGTISGSPLANVATTGVVTIPMMKNLGYKPAFAAAVESVASTGGLLMPPIMGVTAFVMADFLEIPYLAVCVAAVLPSILYYIAVFVMVDLEAVKTGLRGLPRQEIPSFRKTLREGWHFLLPLAVLIYFLAVLGYSPEVSCSYALGVLVLVSVFKKETRLGLKEVLNALENTALAMTQMAPVASAIGIVVTCVGLTGVGLRLSGGLVEIAGGNLLILTLLAAVASLILGMGVPPLSSYVVLALLVAPALVMLKVTPIAAHMFVMYFAALSFITPPICVAVYIAAGIADSSIMRTGFEAVKLGIVAFVVPFMFIYHPVLLLKGTLTEILLTTITSVIGCVALANGIAGHLLRSLNWIKRILMIGVAFLLIYPGWFTDIIGVGVLASVVLWQWLGGIGAGLKERQPAS